MSRRNVWLVWIGSGIALVAAGWVLWVSLKQVERNQRIEEEVMLLQNEADRIRRENETLTEKIRYFSSDTFREQEAKKKLGLRKSGETTVAIRPRMETEVSEDVEGWSRRDPEADAIGPEPFADGTKNYKKWWRVFFGEKR